MSGEPLTRRAFLGGAAALGAAALIGAAVRLARGGEPAAMSSSTTTTLPEEPTTTAPPATNTSAATEPPSTTSTQPPATTSPHAEETTTTAQPVAARIDVIPKAAWGAAPVAGDFIEHQINQITVHHTAVLLADNAAAPARLRQHQSYHQSLGWPDLAYHYVIDGAGHVYEGRPVAAVGDTATDYDPTGHLLICCEGDFNQQEVSAAQYDSLIAMLAWGAAQHEIELDEIRGHRDVAATTCPGDNLYALIADGTIASDVTVLLAGPPAPTLLPFEAAADLIVAIESASA